MCFLVVLLEENNVNTREKPLSSRPHQRKMDALGAFVDFLYFFVLWKGTAVCFPFSLLVLFFSL
jgi:hypothetical protein